MTFVAETFVFKGSSNLAEASYDPDTETLRIEFQDGSEYDYFNVPNRTYTSLTLAGSAGEYFHRNIKGRFSYQRA